MTKEIKKKLNKYFNEKQTINKENLLNEVFVFVENTENVIKNSIIFSKRKKLFLNKKNEIFNGKWEISDDGSNLILKINEKNILLEVLFKDDILFILFDKSENNTWMLVKNRCHFEFQSEKNIYNYIEKNIKVIEKNKILIEKEKTENFKKFNFTNYKIFFNSISISFLTFFILIFTHHILTIFSANYFDIPTKIGFMKVYFVIPDSSPLWTHSSVIATYFTPFLFLIFGVFFYRMFVLFKKKKGSLKLFFLWLYLYSFSFVFSSYLAGLITKKGFHYVFAYLYFSFELKIVLGILFFAILFLIGVVSNSNVLEMSFKKTRITNGFSQLYFKFRLIFLPILTLFSILLIPVLILDTWYEFLILLFMLIPFLGILKYKNSSRITIVENDKEIFEKKYFISFIILFLFSIYFFN